MRRVGIAVASLAVWCAVARVEAKTFYPMIQRISPAAVPAGATIECEVAAEHGFFSPTEVLVTGEGVTGEILPQAAPSEKKPSSDTGSDSIKIRFKAAADALAGIRDVRIITARGPSTLGQLLVVRAPLVREAASNNTRKTAQRINLPATICGALDANEDVDCYRFQVAAGATLTFDLHCQRLQHKLGPITYHADPMLVLRNAAGTVLITDDNSFANDPVLHYRFATAGEYILEVRDVRYAGYRHWVYALEIHDRPFVRQALPGVAVPGVATRMKLLGFNLPADATTSFKLPADTPEGTQCLLPVSVQGRLVDPLLPVHASRLPLVAEKAGSNDTPQTAQIISTPMGIAGAAEKPEDVDCYAFDAHKGERFTFAVVAQAIGSPLDSYLTIVDAKGTVLAENDDYSDKTGNADCRNEITAPDSRIENWTVPADGRYAIAVRDTHFRGGPQFTYYLEMRPARAYFRLELDTDKTVLAPGVSTTLFVRAFRREGLEGAIRLAVQGLPPGVVATCGHIPASSQDACIFLTATAKARSGDYGNIRVVGECAASNASEKGQKLTAVAEPFQELRRDGGARYLVPVEMHTVAIADSLDLKAVHVSPTVVSLKPGESRTIEVSFERAPGFKEPVTLTAVHFQHVWVYGRCLPAGVTIDDRASQARIAGDQTKGTLVLKAAADAKPAEPRLVPVMANVAINFTLKMIYCGEPILLSVDSKP